MADSKGVLRLLEEKISGYLHDPPVEGLLASRLELTVPHEEQLRLQSVLQMKQLSYRDALLIQLAYSLAQPDADITSRQPGARGVARSLGTYLKAQHIAAVDDAYQNIGKNSPTLVRGNVEAFDSFLTWANNATPEQRRSCFEYACALVASTARPVRPMPELNRSKLSFAAMLALISRLVETPSAGAHEQYLVASLLHALVQQNSLGDYRVETKKLNAADSSSRAAGDVQILLGSRVLEA